VLATQNPIEQEGTYPLPEAQLDRFMLKIQVDYPSREQEITVTKRGSTAYHYETGHLLTVEEILAMQELVRRLPVGDHVYEFAVDLVRRSRPNRLSNGDFISQMVTWGAGPRACIFLVLAAKARAILQGRYHATTEDIAAMALPVLRHRLIPSFHAEAAGQSSDYIIRQLIAEAAGQRPAPAPQASRMPFPPPPRIQGALSKLQQG
jgi:MoxR-like ATPase